MSVVRLALRLATVMALKGKTLAGDDVGDSVIAAADARMRADRAPAIVVYIDDAARNLRVLLAEQPKHSIWLDVELMVTAKVERGNQTHYGVHMTDAGLECLLDVMERQVDVALSDTESAWAELHRSLHLGAGERRSIRAAADQGIRTASRQISMELHPITEPTYGNEPSGVWARLLELMAAEPECVHLVPLVRNMLTGDVPAHQWQIDIRDRLLSDAQTDALLLRPVPGAEADVAITSVDEPDAEPGS